MRKLATVLAVCLLFPAGVGAVHADASSKASGPFRIARIHYAQGAMLNSEYLVVRNVSSRTRALTGYAIVDPNDRQRYRFPKTILKPGVTVTLHTGSGRNRAHHRYWRQDAPMWNNDGTAVLKKPGGKVVDRCVYNGSEGGTKVC
jgi:hypothetical protein